MQIWIKLLYLISRFITVIIGGCKNARNKHNAAGNLTTKILTQIIYCKLNSAAIKTKYK